MTPAETALAMMLHFAPVERLPQFPGYEETPEQSLERYGKIAEAIGAACEGAKNERDCLALLVALGTGESHFAADVEAPRCYHGGGHKSRCDADHRGNDRAHSVWQLQRWYVDPATGDVVTGEKLRSDRHLAARLALKAARGSLGRCRKLPAEDRLAALGGSCKPNASARARYRLWRSVAAWVPKEER